MKKAGVVVHDIDKIVKSVEAEQNNLLNKLKSSCVWSHEGDRKSQVGFDGVVDKGGRVIMLGGLKRLRQMMMLWGLKRWWRAIILEGFEMWVRVTILWGLERWRGAMLLLELMVLILN